MLLKIKDRLVFKDAKNLFNKTLVKFNIRKDGDDAIVDSVEFEEKDKDNIVNREYIDSMERKTSAGVLSREKALTIGSPKNLWYLVGENDYIYIRESSVERSIDNYFKTLALINDKSEPNLPEGVRKRFARAVARYNLPIHLLSGFGLKEDSQAHAAYMINSNKIVIVPEYFIRMGVVRVGGQYIDEFSKTTVHEFGHTIWHQVLGDKQRLGYEQLAPNFLDETEHQQLLLTGSKESDYTKGYTDTLSGKRVFGEYWTVKDDKFLSSYARMSIKEDFAETFLHYILAPDFLMGFDEARYNFFKNLTIPSTIIEKGDLIVDGKKEPVQISDLITIDLQTSEMRRKLALEFESALSNMMESYNIGLEQIKNVIPYGDFVQMGENIPASMKVVSYVTNVIGDKNYIGGNVDISLLDTQEKVDAIIYNQRVNVEDTKPEQADSNEMADFYNKCDMLDVEEFEDEVRINKRYYKKDEIDHWVTTPSGTHIPIPKEGMKGYRKIFQKPSKGGKALVAIAQGKKRPPTQREVKERVGKLPLGHVETKAGKLPKNKKFTSMVSEYSVQRHFSEKAPDHHDLRLKMGNKAYSWAVTVWPKPGEKQLAVLQPAHSVEYMKFKGVIPKGQYGAGRVDLIDHNKVDITDWDKKKIAFNVYSGSNKGRYALIDIGNKNFLLVRKTRIRKYPNIEYHPAKARVKFREEMWDSIDYTLQPEMKGIRYLLYVGGNNGNQLLSRSFSEVDKGHHVDHTDNVPHLRDLKFEQKDLVLDGKIYRGNEETTSSIMNSNPMRSRELQAKHGKVTYYVSDILRYKGNDLRSLPYKMRLKFLERAVGGNKYPNVKILPSFNDNKKAHYKKLIRMGFEGVAFKNLNGPYGDRFMTKVRPVHSGDYVIMGATPGKGKFEGMFGALIYGKYTDGKLTQVGKVSGGFSEKERVAIDKKLKSYIKQKKVISLKHLQTKEGKLEDPVFAGLNDNKTWHDLFAVGEP